ncbi:ABC transporter ATP-binding protein [bacterium]|nr:ABC transporter ATP-binding protein [bacterium]
MEQLCPAIEIKGLSKRYKKREAVSGLDLVVEPGICYGLFGQNGAGKTTTIRCLLGLLRPQSGTVRIFGYDPLKQEEQAKSRLAYVPETLGFYPWMTVAGVLKYTSAFYPNWDWSLANELLARFAFNRKQKIPALSKGQKAQLALIEAISTGCDLLVLDEPTSGLDPLTRSEFIRTVIGAFQEDRHGQRTILVSTHLINEFEGLIERFTIIDRGRSIVTSDSDQARARYKKIQLFFEDSVPECNHPAILALEQQGKSLELVTDSFSDELLRYLKSLYPSRLELEALSLEEIFIATLRKRGEKHV